jgi:HSP20 family protein
MIKHSFGYDFWRAKTGVKQPLSTLRDEVERAFQSITSWVSGLQGVTPRVDLVETEDGVEIEAELPGVDQSQIDLSLAGSNLVITGEKKSSRTESDNKSGFSERNYGRFSRSIALPFEPHADGVTANFRNGVLNIRVSKPENLKPKSQKIPITP